MATPGEDVYCTLVMSDSYLPGAAVLAHSLRDAGTKKKLAALITLDTLSADSITELKGLYDILIPVDRIRNPNPGNLYLMDRADLAFAFTKVHLWRQTRFRKIVYLDADIVVVRAPDELFDIEASFAAAPDVGWPDCFNTGVMALTPNMGEYWALQTLAATGDSFDGADQGLLNQYYEHRGWHRLSFTYNCTPNAQYQWEPAYRHFKRDISMVHFIGKDKPWVKGRQSVGSGVYNELLGRWWATYDRHLKQPASSASASQPSSINGVKQHVQGEGGNHGNASPTSIPQIIEPEALVVTTEQPMTEPADHPEKIELTLSEQPPSQERKFSAPQMEWDATRSAPPVESKPEAANFPTAQYEFSESRNLFQPPQSYPEPPKDMWYEVPKTKPKVQEAPPPIFPWEKEREQQKPTRIFADDLPQQPLTVEIPAARSQSPEEDEFGRRKESLITPPTASWDDFTHTSNAWDEVPGIESYVRAIMGHQQNKKSKPQGLTLPPMSTDLGSPTITRKARRESLILTDFPSEVERPSLPVTPAPIRRPTFWGVEKDVAEELPAAEGVPDQAEWVCPKCGLSSDSASTFRRRRRSSSPASTVTAVAMGQGPSPAVSPATIASAPEQTKAQELGTPAVDDAASSSFSTRSSAPPSVTSPSAVPLSPTPLSEKPVSLPSPPEPLTLHPPPSHHYHLLPFNLRPVLPKRRTSSEIASFANTRKMTSPSAVKEEASS